MNDSGLLSRSRFRQLQRVSCFSRLGIPTTLLSIMLSRSSCRNSVYWASAKRLLLERERNRAVHSVIWIKY